MFGLVKSDCPEGQYWRCTLGKKYFSLMLFFSMNLLIYLNAAINPFIYYYRLFKRSEKIKKQHYTRGASMASGLARAGSRDLLSKDHTATRGSVSPPHDNGDGEHVKTPLVKREKSNGHNGMTLQVKPAVPLSGVKHSHLEVYTSC